ncbi:MAG: signal recognition particle-docking protein FtsY [Lachnospiraceae bacterium]|nr:signal recognition particle-docking protein FtsY [Candidatus Darwinimomas equi]
MILQKFFNAIRGIEIDDDFYDELEETLIMADVGARTASELTEDLKDKVRKERLTTPGQAEEALKQLIKEKMSLKADAYSAESENSVYMLIGVNGAGKTTTCGKLACQLKEAGRNVLLVAADTFRAAAIEQLDEWSRRAGVDIVSTSEGSDPGAVIFNACDAAKSKGYNTLIADTAGRLHNKANLMAELSKLYKIIDRELPAFKRETLVVLDSTTGQNAIEQARQFGEAADITGIVPTKMDGTAKGGVAVAIQAELGIPVKYIGYGEKISDLKKFDVDEYLEGLFKDEQ